MMCTINIMQLFISVVSAQLKHPQDQLITTATH